jgi:hypothetical protein
MTPKATPLQSPGSEAPPSLSQEAVESREEKNDTIEKTEEHHGEKPPDRLEQVPHVAEQTEVQRKLSLEETSLVTVESKPVAAEIEVHEEAVEKALQPAEPKEAQEEPEVKPETAEHPEHVEPEVDMTGSVSISFYI